MTYEYKTLSVADIKLDKGNPRFPPVKTEREAIMAMLQEQDEKLYVLAKDIAHYGLDPSRRLIVFKERSDLVDGDGNRRMTALRLLETPDIISNHKLHSKFKKLSKDKTIHIDKVDCVVFKSREDVKHWLEINHGGYLDGRGQIPWSSEQKDRFEGGKSVGLQAKELLLEKGYISAEEFDEVNVTTLSRLLKSKPGQTALSIKIEKGHITFNDMDRLHTVYNDLKGKSVKTVYHDVDRKDFLMGSLGSLEPSKETGEGAGGKVPAKKTVSRRTQRVPKGNRPIFGEDLYLEPGQVNNIYRDICDIYEMGKGTNRCVEILGFSLRLILDVAAHEYFEENPKDGQIKDQVYRDYIRIIKKTSTKRNADTLAVDKSILNLIDEEKVEAMLGKLAHGSVQTSMDTVLNLSFIIGPILKIHFSRES